MIAIPTRLKVLAAAGILCGGIGAAAVGGAFAAPAPGLALDASPTPTATGASPSASPTAHPRWGGRGPMIARFGGINLQSIATYLGMNVTDLRSALSSGQTLAQVAQAHGKSASDLKTYLHNQLKARLDQEVAAGRITADRENALLSNADARFDQLINANLSQIGKPRGGPGFGHVPVGDILTPVAQLLGMNVTDLRNELRSGKSLAQIAQEHGKGAGDVETAIINALKPRIEQMINRSFTPPAAKTPTPASSPTSTPTQTG